MFLHLGQEQADGCTETCLKYVGGVEDFYAFSQELLRTLYVFSLNYLLGGANYEITARKNKRLYILHIFKAKFILQI